MNAPVLVNAQSFQEGWAKAIVKLSEPEYGWKIWNLMVQINNPLLFSSDFHRTMTEFALQHNYIEPKKVAYTIFPYKLNQPQFSRDILYRGYWKYFEMTRHMEHSSWGTYFERMIRYPTPSGNIDQLGSIIDNIRNREQNYGASYAIIIPEPNHDLHRIMSAPCLNYITIQVETDGNDRRIVNMLAVYRNHYFAQRAYGNYFGLCKLIEYIAEKSNSLVGALTCVSSCSQVENYKRELLGLARDFLNLGQ